MKTASEIIIYILMVLPEMFLDICQITASTWIHYHWCSHKLVTKITNKKGLIGTQYVYIDIFINAVIRRG